MKNGLYSIHVTLLDGRVGKGSGVILFRDGQILGGDAYVLYYTGRSDFLVISKKLTETEADACPVDPFVAKHSGVNSLAFLAASRTGL